jgi:hypothetical protein
MATSAQLERKAERARERLSDRIADLRYHVSPTTVVGDLLGGVNARNLGDDLLPILAKQARHNPIASLLIAAGVGWLIFSEVRGPIAKSLGIPKNLSLKSLDLSRSLGLASSSRTTTRRRKKRRAARSSKAANGRRSK